MPFQSTPGSGGKGGLRYIQIPEGYSFNRPNNVPPESTSPSDDLSNEWPDPSDIKISLPSVQAMQPEMIPKPLRDYMVDIADRMRCPLDYVAVTAILTIGSVIGARCGIYPKAHDNWMVVPNLWGAIVGDPSQLKTPSTSEVMKLLNPLERSARERFKEAHVEEKVEAELRKVEKKAITKRLEKGINQHDVDRLKEIEAAEAGTPTLRRYRTQDVTVEKLGELCAENPQGILVFRDELTGLLKSWEKQGNEGYRAFYLEAWTGSSPYTVDRVMKGTFWIERLCVSVFGSIQPDKLQSYLHQTTNGGNDGMLQRFQLMVYPDKPQWEYVDRPPDGAAKERAQEIIRAIAEVPDYTAFGADQWEPGEIPLFRFDGAAQQIFIDWITQLERDKLRNEELSPYLKEHFAKYRSLMPSLALIFHLISNIHRPVVPRVGEASAELAVKWCAYLESHALRIYNGLGCFEQQAAFELSKKISALALPDQFKVRDIQRKNWHLLNDRKAIDAAVAELVDAGWIKQLPQQQAVSGQVGRRPSAVYQVNPRTRKFYSKSRS